jgi:hypothetical protein
MNEVPLYCRPKGLWIVHLRVIKKITRKSELSHSHKRSTATLPKCWPNPLAARGFRCNIKKGCECNTKMSAEGRVSAG